MLFEYFLPYHNANENYKKNCKKLVRYDISGKCDGRSSIPMSLVLNEVIFCSSSLYYNAPVRYIFEPDSDFFSLAEIIQPSDN